MDEERPKVEQSSGDLTSTKMSEAVRQLCDLVRSRVQFTLGGMKCEEIIVYAAPHLRLMVCRFPFEKAYIETDNEDGSKTVHPNPICHTSFLGSDPQTRIGRRRMVLERFAEHWNLHTDLPATEERGMRRDYPVPEFSWDNVG